MDIYNLMNYHISTQTNKKPKKKYSDFSDEQKEKIKETQKKYYASEHGKLTRDAYFQQPDILEKRKAYAREYYINYHQKNVSKD